MSARTRVLVYIFRMMAAIFVLVALGLIASLIGSIAFKWESAPVPQMCVAMVYAAVATVALRIALAWSIGRERRDNT